MIIANVQAQTSISVTEFESLLDRSKIDLQSRITSCEKIPTPTEFEDLVVRILIENAYWTSFENTIYKTNKHAFPDIKAGKIFGIEVKMSEKDHWTTVWNSIFESLREDSVERIYVLFWKFGWERTIRYRLYQECVSDISITHSPRYKLNMELPLGLSVFDLIGLAYDSFRKMPDKMGAVRNLYKDRIKPGDDLWWFDTTELDGNELTVRQFRNLDSNEKEKLTIELLILFPRIFGKEKTKYEMPSSFLVAKYWIVYPNIRDAFSAWGKKNYTATNGRTVRTSANIARMLKMAYGIRDSFEKIDHTMYEAYWPITPKDNADGYAIWKDMILWELEHVVERKELAWIAEELVSVNNTAWNIKSSH